MKTRLKRQLTALARHLTGNSGQCSRCSGWFDNWPGGICAACQAIGR